MLKTEEVCVSEPPFVVTVTVMEVRAIAFAVFTDVVPLESILMPLTVGLSV